MYKGTEVGKTWSRGLKEKQHGRRGKHMHKASDKVIK